MSVGSSLEGSVTTLDEYACEMMSADFTKDTVTVLMHPGYRIRAGKYFLLTEAAYERLCRKDDPAP